MERKDPVHPPPVDWRLRIFLEIHGSIFRLFYYIQGMKIASLETVNTLAWIRIKTAARLILPVLLLCSVLPARPVDLSDIQSAAERLMELYASAPPSSLRKASPMQIEQIQSYQPAESPASGGYLVLLAPAGFAVFTADTRMPPVIAYSFSSSWHTEKRRGNPIGNLIDGMLARLMRERNDLSKTRQLENETAWKQLLGSDGTTLTSETLKQWPEPGTTATDGWLESQFYQSSPFNLLCPLDPETGYRTYTGCVATAMAQVLHYHEDIGDVTFDAADRYSTTTRSIAIDQDSTRADFPSFHRLNTLLDDIRRKYPGGGILGNHDLAALSFAAGVSVEMDFTSQTSTAGTERAAQALKQHFGYSQAEYIYLNPNSQEPSPIYHRIKNDMMNGLPAILSIHSDLEGHAIVCDGYNTDGFFHLNYGWGAGQPVPIKEAWFLIPEELGSVYHEITGGIVNIRPDPEEPVLAVQADTLNLGIIQMGRITASDSLILTCSGETTVTVEDITVSSPFSVSLSADFNTALAPFSMNPGDSRVVYVRFQPERFEPVARDLIIAWYGNSMEQPAPETCFLHCVVTGTGIPQNSTAVQETEISGNWTKDHSPYIIFSAIEIPAGQTLSVESGVEILFTGPYLWIIGENSRLVCRGTEEAPVFIHAADSTVPWGGMLFSHSSADDSLLYCRIEDISDLDISRGAVSVRHCSPFFSHCRFQNNRSTWRGLLDFAGSESAISFCSFINNTVPYGLIRASESTLQIRNTLITENQTDQYGLITSFRSVIDMNHDSVARNRTGRLFHLNQESRIHVLNSIVWDNETEGFSPRESYGVQTYQLDYTCFDTSAADWTFWKSNRHAIRIPGGSNIFTDPLWMEHASPAFLLQENSPCIDAGDPADPVESEPFPHGYRVNLGAYGGTADAQITSGPAAAVLPARLDFGNLSQPETDRKTVLLANGGTTAFQVTHLFLTDGRVFQLSDGPDQMRSVNLPVTLWPGQTDSVTLIFRPDYRYTHHNADTLVLITSGSDTVRTPVSGSARSGTDIAGGELDGWLTRQNQPFHIYGDIVVPAGKTLIMEPGIHCYFMGPYSITVKPEGCLKAEGSISDSICFTGMNPSTSWRGINFIHTRADNRLSYCVFQDCIRPMNAYCTNEFNSPLCGVGALLVDESTLSLSHSSFTANQGRSGGAVYSSDSDISISHCFFKLNTANRGGAVFLSNPSREAHQVSIRNVLLTGNFAYETGGGFYINLPGCTCEINHATIVQNTAIDQGGGMHLEGRNELLVQNSILWQNNAFEGTEISLEASEKTLILRYSTIDTLSDNWRVLNPAFYSYATDAALELAEGNQTDDPLFTDPENGIFTLRARSPCIDAGDPEAVEDIEDPGRLRFALSPARGTVRNDMGAFGGGSLPLANYILPGVGWHLLGFSMRRQTFCLQNCLPQTETAWIWDSSGNRYVETDTIGSQQGFWIRTETGFTGTVGGLPVYQDTLHLSRGWHLISGISESLPVSAVQTLPEHSLAAAYAWNAETQQYTSVGTMKPGMGVWVAIFRECDLVMDSKHADDTYLPKISGFLEGDFARHFGSTPPPPPEIQSGESLPVAFDLQPNVPNPFNGTTTLRYQISKPVHVKIEIFNLLGRHVRTCVDEDHEPGRYRFSWTGTNTHGFQVPSGIYFCRMTAAAYCKIQKMIRIN